ncbi:hypothetical protein ACHQM5_022824 [Ranunculus cassubicifolius]
MATAIVFKPIPLTKESKLQSLCKYSTNLPKFPIFCRQKSQFLLQCSINSKKWSTDLPGTERNTFPLQSFPAQLMKNRTNLTNICRKDSTFIIQSLANLGIFGDLSSELEEKEKDLFMFEGVIRKIAVAALILGLLLYDHSFALAATGGRMGGRLSSTSTTSSSRTSSSVSSPSTSSSRSSSSPSSSYSSSYSSPSSTSFSYYSSTGYAPYYPVRVSSSESLGSGLAFTFVLWACMSVVMSAITRSNKQERGYVVSGGKTSVIKLQVCLLGMARSLQKDLDQIAEVADTSTSEGLNFILRETVLALLRHPDCCISCYSSVDVKQNSEDGEKRFDQLSIEERGKLDEETLLNVNNIKRKKTSRKPQDGESRNEYIVITILVSSEGTHKLPLINTTSDLKEALQQLGSISSSNITAVEVLWTPQEENDTLLEQELLENYPHLRQLQDG